MTHALYCDVRLADELHAAQRAARVAQLRLFNDDSPAGLETAMARHPDRFDNVATAVDDTRILALHLGNDRPAQGDDALHRDVMASCACWPRHVLRPRPDDVFIGSPPLAFTFGPGGLVLFPMSVGASCVLIER